MIKNIKVFFQINFYIYLILPSNLLVNKKNIQQIFYIFAFNSYLIRSKNN